ncbi:hypothetical protein RO3G_12025 [Rhizopus delemar RA 99-880]|uniref:Uncharacterized protein n=1 Tax=Rhizopus delemar (strain RA 99-880 / ATCC MYA-4621 / FGSC 9543 / NRRL 43880) TaxID=246409 RepID=I1CFT4_RHIO9|nr:hypothetical protein RO3G_12025 [Rhizopus delemar RA 99-880]|eukprot:EIE87314.1 hypothetical protein RO3G_12025 [Rhizopus delemar RA 99-880]
MQCKEYLHQLIITRFLDSGCAYCGGVSSEEHLSGLVPFKYEIWLVFHSLYDNFTGYSSESHHF